MTSTTAFALQTPFVQPTSCADVIAPYTTSVLTGTTVVINTWGPVTAPAFTSCQPTQWQGLNNPNAPLSFSPAVCPSQWTAYNLALANTADTPASVVETTAYCCARWVESSVDDPQPANILSLRNYTLAFTSPKAICTQGDPIISSTMTETWHEAYTIAWKQADVASLSPQPPPLESGCSLTISTWVPGSTAPAVCRPKEEKKSANLNGLWALVALPVVAVLAFAGYWWYRVSRFGDGEEDDDTLPASSSNNFFTPWNRGRQSGTRDVDLHSVCSTVESQTSPETFHSPDWESAPPYELAKEGVVSQSVEEVKPAV